MSDRNPSKSLLDSTHATIPTTSAAAIDGAMESQAHHIKPLETACPSPPHGEHFTIEKTNPTENLTTTSAQLNDGSVQTGTGSPRIKNPQDGLNTPVEISSDQPVLPRNEFGRTAMDDGYFKQEINNEPGEHYTYEVRQTSKSSRGANGLFVRFGSVDNLELLRLMQYSLKLEKTSSLF